MKKAPGQAHMGGDTCSLPDRGHLDVGLEIRNCGVRTQRGTSVTLRKISFAYAQRAVDVKISTGYMLNPD
jgi:hypothetical protein